MLLRLAVCCVIYAVLIHPHCETSKGKNFPSLTFLFFEMMPESPKTTILNLLSLVRYVLAKFEVFIRSKFY